MAVRLRMPVMAALAVVIRVSVALDGPLTMESAKARQTLPLYKVLAAAKDEELTRSSASGKEAHVTWSRSHGDASNARYSSLAQINRNNVHELTLAWVYHSGDGQGNIQANPVIVDGVLYAPTVGRNIVAIDAGTGHEIWRYRPVSGSVLFDTVGKSGVPANTRTRSAPGPIDIGYGPAARGLTYWDGDAGSPRLYFMDNGYLLALSARSGQPVESFGDHGRVASSKGAGSSSFIGAVAPAVFKSVIIAPNQNKVDAFDVVSGAHLWSFDTLKFRVEDPTADNGGNVWGGIAMDTARGIAFVVAGDPHPNFVGVGRIGRNEHANSLIALDAVSGRLLWSFQEVAHNLWDLDTPAPPNLVGIQHHGRRVDAVAEVTKFGNTLLLDRLSGKPLFSYRLRRAPVSTVPDERTWPYQPALELPQPFARQTFSLADVSALTPDAQEFVLKEVARAKFGWFEPPHLEAPTIFYGVHGGAEWTGASFDPTSGWLYVSANELAWVESLSRVTAPRSTNQTMSAGQVVFLRNCALCHGEHRQGKGMAPSLAGVGRRLSQEQIVAIVSNGRNAMPAVAIPQEEERSLLDFLLDAEEANPPMPGSPVVAESYEALGFTRLLDDQGYPGNKPPWGTLNAINLNTGKLMWKVPLGEYEELKRRGIPKTGTENFGGATVTAGGLVFCAGTRDLKIRAFDKFDGRELWSYKLPFGGFAPPATYQVNGRQYVVIAATGGGKLGGEMGDAYVAFALPKR